MLKFDNMEKLAHWLYEMFEVIPTIPYKRTVLDSKYWGIKKIAPRPLIRIARVFYGHKYGTSIKTVQLDNSLVWHVRKTNLISILILDMKFWDKYNTPEAMVEAWSEDENLRRQSKLEESLRLEEERARGLSRILRAGKKKDK